MTADDELTPTSVAALRRAMVPGTVIDIVNRRRPVASRTTTVLPKTNTVDLVTSHPDAPHGSHLAWPKAGQVLTDGTAFFIVDPDSGDWWLSITPVSDEA